MIKAMSLGSSVRGLVHRDKDGVNRRPDAVVFDDIDTDASVNNVSIIDANYRFLKGEVFGALATDCQKIILVNVIAEDGLMPRFEQDYKNKYDYYRVPFKNRDKKTTFITKKQ